MNGLARSCWIASPLYLLIGMVFGIWMAATGDHTFSPAHAHLNLIGGVLMALFGVFYALRPNAATGLARIQVALAHIAVWAIFPGLIIALSGGTEAFAKAGAVAAILSMILFIWIVVRATAPQSA